MTSSGLRVLVVLALSAVVAACTTRSNTTIVASTYPRSSTTMPPGWIPATRLPGGLNGPASGMTGDELRAAVLATAKAGSHTRPRRCTSYFSCFFGGGKTDVTITATQDIEKLNSTNAGQYGTIAAMVDGIHHDTEGYPFRKNDLYAFIVYPETPTAAAYWELQEIVKNSTGPSYSHSVVDHGMFHECTKGANLYWDNSTADFLACNRAPHPTPVVTHMGMFGGFGSFLLNLMNFREGDDDPAWISCESGCCTMSAA